MSSESASEPNWKWSSIHYVLLNYRRYDWILLLLARLLVALLKLDSGVVGGSHQKFARNYRSAKHFW